MYAIKQGQWNWGGPVLSWALSQVLGALITCCVLISFPYRPLILWTDLQGLVNEIAHCWELIRFLMLRPALC